MAENGSEEREPLLQNDHFSMNQNVQQTTVSPVSVDEIPVVTEQYPDGDWVRCEVCHSAINISGYRVAKCDYCNESTPIKDAPPGKKYVRCPCNYLITCKATSQEITCPRPNCKRKNTNLSPSPVATARPAILGMFHLTCVYCRHRFLFYTALKDMLTRCPHCGNNSSVVRQLPQNRAIAFLAVAVVCLVIAARVTYSMYVSSGIHAIIDATFIFAIYFPTIVFIYKAIYYCTTKVSVIESPA